MSGQINTGESRFKAQMSIIFEAQMSYRFTGKKAQTFCALFLCTMKPFKCQATFFLTII